MELLRQEAWPAAVAIAILTIAAVINYQTLGVPNWLTFGGVISGWAVGILANSGIVEVRGGLVASLAATAISFGVLFPWVLRRFLGEGCVKAQMAFGAWIGNAIALEPAATIALISGVVGSLTLLAYTCMMLILGRIRQQRVLGLWLPAQVPLSIGSVGGVGLWQLWG